MVNVRFYQITLKSMKDWNPKGSPKDIRKSVNERVNWKMNGTFLNYWNIFDLLAKTRMLACPRSAPCNVDLEQPFKNSEM